MSKSKEVRRAEKNEIRRLLNSEDKRYTDKEIMTQLDIKRAGYYRYKNEIEQEDWEDWQKIRTETLESQQLKILDTIQTRYIANKKIVDDPESSAQDIRESAKEMQDAKLDYFRFSIDPSTVRARAKVLDNKENKQLEHKRQVSN